MKKVFRFFLLVLGMVMIGGCSKVAVTDLSGITYLEETSVENIAVNLANTVKRIKGTSFKGTLKIDDKLYEFNGEIIVNSTIEESLIHIKYKDNNLYIKDGNVYISYYYNNTNVIVKDELEVFIDEGIIALKSKGIAVDKEDIEKIIKDKTIEDINYNFISGKMEKVDSNFVLKYEENKMIIDNNYLVKELFLVKDNVELSLEFEYGKVDIDMPLGYDLFTINLEEIKELMRVNSMVELIK